MDGKVNSNTARGKESEGKEKYRRLQHQGQSHQKCPKIAAQNMKVHLAGGDETHYGGSTNGGGPKGKEPHRKIAPTFKKKTCPKSPPWGGTKG